MKENATLYVQYPYMDQLLHLVREVAVVGAELQVEVDHGELGARLHPAGDGRTKVREEGAKKVISAFSAVDESL